MAYNSGSTKGVLFIEVSSFQGVLIRVYTNLKYSLDVFHVYCRGEVFEGGGEREGEGRGSGRRREEGGEGGGW